MCDIVEDDDVQRSVNEMLPFSQHDNVLRCRPMRRNDMRCHVERSETSPWSGDASGDKTLTFHQKGNQ